jgi:hypothetical protein
MLILPHGAPEGYEWFVALVVLVGLYFTVRNFMRRRRLREPMRPIWRGDEGPDAAKRLSRLREGFQSISRRWDPASRRRKFYRALWCVGAVGAFTVTWYFLSSPWPPVPTLKHLAAFPNCNAARLVGLAPAWRGEPGYWSRHDRDKDGIACEPWPQAKSGSSSIGSPGGSGQGPKIISNPHFGGSSGQGDGKKK